jgi:hypothetical protein
MYLLLLVDSTATVVMLQCCYYSQDSDNQLGVNDFSV